MKYTLKAGQTKKKERGEITLIQLLLLFSQKQNNIIVKVFLTSTKMSHQNIYHV